MAAYLACCSHPARQLPSGVLLIDKRLSTESAPLRFYTDQNVDIDSLVTDMVSGAAGHDQGPSRSRPSHALA